METKKKLFVTTEDISPKLFKNSFLDFFTRIPWYFPIIIFLPVISFLFYRGFTENRPTIFTAFLVLFSAIFIWTLFEYCVHRFLFHAHPNNKILKEIHHTFHGIHHDFPQDTMRLVMPPMVSIPILTLIYFGSQWFFQKFEITNLHNIFFASFMLGYLVYDEMHYASHHLNWKNKWFQAIKKQHMKHHFVEPDMGFGFTSKGWDLVFKTDFPEKKK
jgi:dihydroceramide fatty acyl 2-hydroxylase